MKLATKTIVLIIFLVGLLCGASSGIMLYFHELSLRQSVHAGIDGMARASALTISGFIHDYHQDAGIIAASLPLEALQAGRMSEVTATLERISQLHGFGNGIFILDSQGRFLADYPSHPELKGTSFAFREYFRRTISEGRGIVGEPYLSKRTGVPVLTFTAPIFDAHKKILAVVACSVDLLAPQALGGLRTQSIGKNGYLYIFDKSRRIILHPDNGRLLKRDVPPGANRLLDRAIDGFEGVGEAVNSRGVPMLMAFRRVPDTPWIVAMQLQKSDAFASLYESRRIMLGAAGGSLIFIIVVGFCAVQKIALPLQHLHSAAKIIVEELETCDRSQEGKVFDLLESIRSRDELGVLAQAFRELVERQRQSVSMLRKAANEWEMTFNSVNEAVLCLDRDGCILRMNRIAGEWLSTTPAAAAGKLAHRLLQGDFAPAPEWIDAQWFETGKCQVWSDALPTREGVYEFAVSGIWDRDRVGGVLLVVRDVTERARMEHAIRQMAFNDALTGLPNRVLLLDRLEQAIHACSRKKSRGGVLFLDLDRFKIINDSYGHDAGDELLRQVARRLEGSLRNYDTVARLGGDEFVIVLQQLDDDQSIHILARKIIALIREPYQISGHTLRIGASIGVALFPDHGTVAQELIARADGAMYGVKRDGGDFRLYRSAGRSVTV